MIKKLLDNRMTAEFDSMSAREPHKMSGASSAASAGGQKLSLFSSKSGFVIPKNKLSGSLVPIFRGAKKDGVTGAINDESSKQVERRSKWGPDLTQDAAVRRAKALALQIRVDQITKQLESLADENPNESNSDSQINGKKSEMLELERREAIGEILKLDPSYKPPPGFKPLLKEASVPLPVQEYPGYKFIGLISGPEGDNQKRLEKETGTKVKIHGTKADTGEKVEIKPGTDIQNSYKEMHVNIAADSFDKVDAAASIIELLITSVTVNGNPAAGSLPSVSVSGDRTSVLSQSQDGPPSHATSLSLENQAVLQPAANTQMHGTHFQYSGPWFSAVPSQPPLFASSGGMVPPNPPVLARTPHFPSQTMNPSNMVSAFGAQPAPVTGFHPIIPNQQFSMQAPQPTQFLPHPQLTHTNHLGHGWPPRNSSVIPTQNLSAPTSASLSFPATLSQPTPIGQLQTSVSSMPQPMSGITPLPKANQPSNPHGVSSSVGLNTMGPMAPPAASPTRPVSLGPQPDVAFKPPQSNMSMMPRHATVPPQHAGMPPGPSSSLGPMPPPIPAPFRSSGNHLSGPVSFPSPGMSPSLPLPQQSGMPNSASGHVKLPASMPLNAGNFTFQSQRPNADYYQVVSGPSSRSTQGGTREPPSGPRPPPFGFTMPEQPLQSFPRTQVPNRVDQTQAHASAVPFGGRSGPVSVPPRHPAFPYAGQSGPRSPVIQMGMKNFISAPQMPNLPSPGVQRGMHRQSYPAQRTWPDNQRFGNSPSFSSGKPAYSADQIYDPFSPTSVAPHQQKGNPGN